ncbi:MAG: ribonuclease E/G [Alphaproteobacteria bacterium]|nr:ribonuclease E/G [Alphaproteobacteria bacterium]
MAELLIAAGPGEWRAAWVERDEAVELYVERGDSKPPGSRHLGRVVRVVRALDAALVDIGDERPAFLPLRDIPAGVKAEEGVALVVEVRREAWQDKAPRLTATLSPPLPVPAGIAPAAQLSPPPGLAAALALRLPRRPEHLIADDAAVLAELHGVFDGVDIIRCAPAGWPVDVDTAFEAALASSLALPAGGTIHIEETRAGTLIDIDTGTPERGLPERAALAANRAAARGIARQLRLRNIGGAVVVDFVGLDRRGAREQVRQALAVALADDPAKPEILGWTRLGYLEVLRPRRGRPLADALLEPASRTKRPVALAHEALRRLQHEARANPAARWRLSVPQTVAAALRGPAASALRVLETRLGRRVEIIVAAGTDGFDIAPS